MDERLMEPTGNTPRDQTSIEVFRDRLQETSSTGNDWLLANSSDKKPDIDDTPPGRPPDPGQQTLKRQKNKKNSDPYKGYVKLCMSGLVLMGVAYFVHFLDPIQMAKDIRAYIATPQGLLAAILAFSSAQNGYSWYQNMNMREGSYLFRVWKSPPIKLYIKVFIFNITNAAPFINGHDKKLKVTEVGPYTYSETLTNEEIVWNHNKTLSYTPQRNVQFEPEMSVGNPDVDVVNVANIPLLGIASLLHNSSAGLNLAVSTLVSYLDSQPILNLTVSSFLWGYEDPLVRLATNIVPSWINFAQFGILDRMLDEGVNRVTMNLQNTKDNDQFSIQKMNGLPGLLQWGYKADEDEKSSHCNRVEGTLEGYIFPRHIQKNQTFTIYRRAFCRPLNIEFDKTGISSTGYPVYLYKFSDSNLDPQNPDNACYCNRQKETCLPYGLSDLSPCYYNFPVAISLPHFLNANKSLIEGLEGIYPDHSKHGSTIAIQPDVGVPVSVSTRLQTNLVVKKTKYIPRVKRFNNIVIPIFWMQVELIDLPLSLNLILYILLEIGPVLQRIVIILCFAVGLILVFLANLRYAWKSGIFNSRRTATLISFRQKQRQHEKIIWRNSRYSQLVINPPATVSDGRTR